MHKVTARWCRGMQVKAAERASTALMKDRMSEQARCRGASLTGERGRLGQTAVRITCIIWLRRAIFQEISSLQSVNGAVAMALYKTTYSLFSGGPVYAGRTSA